MESPLGIVVEYTVVHAGEDGPIIGLVVVAGGTIRFYRGNLEVRLAGFPADARDRIAAALKAFEGEVEAGTVDLTTLPYQSGEIRFGFIVPSATHEVETFSASLCDEFLNDDEPMEPKREPGRENLGPAFRYFVANHGCRRHGLTDFSCGGCRADYLALLQRIVRSMDERTFHELRLAILDEEASEKEKDVR